MFFFQFDSYSSVILWLCNIANNSYVIVSFCVRFIKYQWFYLCIFLCDIFNLVSYWLVINLQKLAENTVELNTKQNWSSTRRRWLQCIFRRPQSRLGIPEFAHRFFKSLFVFCEWKRDTLVKNRKVAPITLLSWAAWANCSQSLLCNEWQEWIAHARSFVQSDLSDSLMVVLWHKMVGKLQNNIQKICFFRIFLNRLFLSDSLFCYVMSSLGETLRVAL